jgi:hypothetical protein
MCDISEVYHRGVRRSILIQILCCTFVFKIHVISESYCISPDDRPGMTGTHCNTLQHTATRSNSLQLSVAACNTSCNTLQPTATHCRIVRLDSRHRMTATHCNAQQCTATHSDSLQHKLQHTSTHCNTL